MMRRGVIEAASMSVSGRSLLSAHLNFKINSTRRLHTAAYHGSTMLRQQFGLHGTTPLIAPVAASFMNYRIEADPVSILMGRHFVINNDMLVPVTDDEAENKLLDEAANEILSLKNDHLSARPSWRPPSPPTFEQIDQLVSTVRDTCFPELFGHTAGAPNVSEPTTLMQSSSSSTYTAAASSSSSAAVPEPCVTSSSVSSAAATASLVDRALMKSQLRRALASAGAIVSPSLVLDALEGGASTLNDPDLDVEKHRPALASASRRMSREAMLQAAEDHWNNVVKPKFASLLPSIVKDINSDVDFTLRQDVATNSRIEVILAYPGVRALLYHRVAHALLHAGAPVLVARLISERGHSLTGIDIHPGATIGGGCFIDHGTGLVIGGTAEIGKNVCLFHGVTLGAKGFPVDAQGRRIKHAKRHPILQDNVSVYAGATILGRIVIGNGASVGAGATVMKDVEPGFTVGATRAPPVLTPPKAAS